MVKNTFWNEASRCGAVIGLVSVFFALVGMLVPTIAFVANIASFVVTIYLLFYYTRRRAQRFANEGYTYTQCLGFIVAIGIFAGIISGAYQIVASNLKYLLTDITDILPVIVSNTLSQAKHLSFCFFSIIQISLGESANFSL